MPSTAASSFLLLLTYTANGKGAKSLANGHTILLRQLDKRLVELCTRFDLDWIGRL